DRRLTTRRRNRPQGAGRRCPRLRSSRPAGTACSVERLRHEPPGRRVHVPGPHVGSPHGFHRRSLARRDRRAQAHLLHARRRTRRCRHSAVAGHPGAVRADPHPGSHDCQRHRVDGPLRAAGVV
ncbi:MAG: hypothetical protein AVDCRST_MAG34-3151, partial [uncultured Nocardioidaceae bacterium]